MDNAELAKWCMRAFVDYNAIPFAKREEPKAKYTGGCHAVSESTLPNIHFAIGFEHAGCYSSKDLFAVSVLQALLGSWMGAPAPGAGLGSKLAALKDVDSAAAFYVPFSDSGVFGVYVSAPAASGGALPGAIKEILKSVKPSAEELARAADGPVHAVEEFVLRLDLALDVVRERAQRRHLARERRELLVVLAVERLGVHGGAPARAHGARWSRFVLRGARRRQCCLPRRRAERLVRALSSKRRARFSYCDGALALPTVRELCSRLPRAVLRGRRRGAPVSPRG